VPPESIAPGDAEARLHHHAVQLLQIHELLLNDGARNRPFYEALKRVVTPGSSVLDIGSGSGLWAIVAAQLGAKKVVAIEREPLLIGLIRALARANGVADRLEVVHGDSRQMQLAREFDVVVSETIGHVIFDEDIVSIMADARRRFLKPGGVLIPGAVALMAAPAHWRSPARLPVEIDAAFGEFEALARHVPLGVVDKQDLEIAGEPCVLTAVDLHQAEATPALDRLTARWTLPDPARINCFAVWAELTLGEGLRASTLETSSWSTSVYRVRPFAGGKVEAEFRLVLTAQSNFWTVDFSDGLRRETQSYSPAYAAAELLALSRAPAGVVGQVKQMGLLHPGANEIENLISLRPAGAGDERFLRQVYAGTRMEELAQVPWTIEQREAFLRMQFDAQNQDYRKNYPAASFDLILARGEPVGRLYVDRREKDIHIIDIALLPEHRNAGIGSALLRGLIAESVAVGKPLGIHVERFNRAQRLYQRLGFVPMEEGPIYLLMRRPAAAS